MSAETQHSPDYEPLRLDWGITVPAPEEHSCDCCYCEEQGQMEEPEWPTLLKFELDGVEYVTDRYMLIRADLAPVPSTYPGHVADATKISQQLVPASASDAVPNGIPFRWQVIRALEECGWRLRGNPDAEKRWAVVNRADEVIGVAMQALARDDDYWSGTVTRDYDEDELTAHWINAVEFAMEQEDDRDGKVD